MAGISRRKLLAGAAAGALLPWIARAAATQAPDWGELARLIGRPVLLPNDPRFVNLTQPENSYYYRQAGTPEAPLAVVRPRSPEEVGKIVKWAHDRRVRMVARSGGHSYAGCSTIHGLIVNTGAMRHVVFDAQNDRLTIGGGVLNGDIFAVLKDLRYRDVAGGAAIVHGRCSAVGASAFLMGGGIGFDMRGYGVGSDLVESVDIALADGSVVTTSVTDKDHADLFWSVLGGGGGNLGIATEWRLKPFAVRQAVVFAASWPATADPRAALTAIVRRLEKAPETLGAQVTVGLSNGGLPRPISVRLIGQFRGTREEFDAACPNLLDGATNPAVVTGPYWEVQEFLDQTPVPNKYLETSLFAGHLTDGAIKTVFDQFRAWPARAGAVRITFFRTGGQVNAKPPDASAFVHRSSEWLANTSLDWTDCDDMKLVHDNMRWQRGFHDALLRALPGQGSYQNFPDPGLADHRLAYWGKNLPRLEAAKRHYDPDLVFTPPRHQEILL